MEFIEYMLRHADVASADADINIRLASSVKIRSAGNYELMLGGDLQQKAGILGAMVRVPYFNAVEPKVNE